MLPSRRSPVLLFSVVFCLLITAPALGAEHGQPLWFDLVTENPKAATSFYSDLFGWEIGPNRGEVQTISHRGRDIAALHHISDELKGQSESQWLVGIAVDDLEEAVASAQSAGGMILRQIVEVPESGRYAVIRDPQGAPLMLGTPNRKIGGLREDGYFVWVELWTDDVDAAAKFYNTVIGYQRKTVEGLDGAYSVLQSGGQSRAGLVKTPNEDVRPVWAPYIGVSDLAATLSQTAELGGRVVLAPRDDFGGGRVALIEDTTHAMVFVVQLPSETESSR